MSNLKIGDIRVSKSEEIQRCPVADDCGACSSIHEPYAAQLADKDECIAQLFAPVLEESSQVKPVIGMDDPYHYRSKVASPFAPGKRGPNGGREILTGMYAAGTHRLVNTDGCLVDDIQANSVVAAIRRIMQKHGMQPYNEDTGEGFMRHVVVRVGHASGEVLVTVVTNAREFPSAKAFCRELVKRCPFIKTIVQNVNLRQTNVILGDEEHTLYGPGFILDTLLGLSIRISSHSFYQTNAVQTEVLYSVALSSAGLTEAPTVIDAYCGTGIIGLVAAAHGAGRVIGVDSVASAIRDARENARHNGIQHAEFVCQDAADFMREAAAGNRFAAEAAAGSLVLMMDPPRSGSTPEFLASAAACNPDRIVYISCNPATQVDDIRVLQRYGYHVQFVQPVDMFPHTDHIECVALLVRENG